MHWVATPEKATTTATLEKRLWDADCQFRANYLDPSCGSDSMFAQSVRFVAEHFKERLETLNQKLESLSVQARGLETTIAANVGEILEG